MSKKYISHLGEDYFIDCAAVFCCSKAVRAFLSVARKVVNHGKSRKEAVRIVAERFGVSPETIHNHCTEAIGFKGDGAAKKLDALLKKARLEKEKYHCRS